MAKLKMTLSRLFTIMIASITGMVSTAATADEEPKAAGEAAGTNLCRGWWTL